MDTLSLLQLNCERLLEQYYNNINAVRDLQITLLDDVLPHIVDELQLDTSSTESAKELLQDTCEHPHQTIDKLFTLSTFASLPLSDYEGGLLELFRHCIEM